MFIRIPIVISLLACAFTLFFHSTAMADTSPLRKHLFLKDSQLKVTHIIDPTTIAVEGGRIIRLSEILIPTPSQKAHEQAREWLSETLKGKHIRLYVTRDEKRGRTNRFGFELGHVERTDGLWIQASMVNRGLAILYPTATNADMNAALLTYEDQAIERKSGLWEKELAIHSAESLKEKTKRFGIVEGKIYSAAMKNNIVYLNFSRNWKEDLTGRIKKENRIFFSRSGLNPLALNGKNVRMRGFVEDYNGPMITLTHPAQIQILSD